MADLERIEAERHGFVPLFGLIWAYAGLEDADHAFAHLERVVEKHGPRVVFLSLDPLVDPLRSDPCFEAILRRVGLPVPGSPGPR